MHNSKYLLWAGGDEDETSLPSWCSVPYLKVEPSRSFAVCPNVFVLPNGHGGPRMGSYEGNGAGVDLKIVGTRQV